MTFSSVIATALLFYTFDQEIQNWIQDIHPSLSNDVSSVVSYLGHGVFIGGLITALYASGELSHNDVFRKTALLSLESFVTSGILVPFTRFFK